MKAHNIIDIIERFQTQHALQEESERQNPHASNNGSVAPGMPDENGRFKTGIFEMEEVRVWTVAVPGSTDWSPPRHGRDRMVVTLGRTRQLPTDSHSAFPGRWACVPANSDFKVPNENQHTRNFLIVEFNGGSKAAVRSIQLPCLRSIASSKQSIIRATLQRATLH